MGFPHVETIIKVTRTSSKNKKGSKPETAYYISSASKEKYTDEQWMQLIRGHWGGIEIRNHWRKDACLLEDATRSRNPNIVGNLGMLRNCYLHFHEQQDKHKSLPALIEAVAADTKLAYRMLKGCF
jgi:predicted transposase YbfD/YdcC